ncbi:MAG TPA: FtsW/RodA/SpoVE family cell cycle protein [Anaerolineales bacterium]|nr:FtsW/RodA/SpoVE family cell cycle protein [Anaerolineales bacterium]
MNRVIQSNLLKLAAVFLVLQSIILTLAPAVKMRTLDADLRFSHWIALFVWGLLVFLIHRAIVKYLPDADPFLFPTAALLSGWGLLAIWRLDASNIGPRQALWLVVSLLVFLLGLRLSSQLVFLRRYKYLLFAGALALVGLTLFFGTNPIGIGPKLWFGCCGLYFQPSEPLKLLLVAYLAAFLADRIALGGRMLAIIMPAFIISNLAVLLLLFQRDLGTALIFMALYTIIIYLATGRRRAILVSVVFIALFGIAGYYFIGVVQARIDSWLHPWDDPISGSYQIIQALLAVANGGIEGRGPGLGNPGIIPVAGSDFIYAAIAEETGLFGTLGLLALFILIVGRGFRAALRAPDLFRRLFAAGITSYFGIQALLIVGGNIRLLPLTGVTLPFVSYGGSSLLVSYIGLLFLMHISNHLDEEPAPLQNHQPYLLVSGVLSLGLCIAALVTGWWSVVRGPDLLTRVDNPRRMIEDQFVRRGALLDRSDTIITTTIGKVGELERSYKYPDLAPVTGYNHAKYGQAGLEASLDEYLRGNKGTPATTIWWNHLLYGMSPTGLDVRLTIDLYLQFRADEMLLGHSGAVVMMNAQTGEILVMSSHPTFNPNHLNEIGQSLTSDPDQPLINRAPQGLYPTGSVIDPFAAALFGSQFVTSDELSSVHESMGFLQPPQLELPAAESLSTSELEHFHVSPLQVALASAALSNHGVIPAPSIASAVNTPVEGWVVLPVLGTPVRAMQAEMADEASLSFIQKGDNFWSHLGKASEGDTSVTWFLAGTPGNWQGTPFVVVVLIEEDNERLAERVGRELIVDAMSP